MSKNDPSNLNQREKNVQKAKAQRQKARGGGAGSGGSKTKRGGGVAGKRRGAPRGRRRGGGNEDDEEEDDEEESSESGGDSEDEESEVRAHAERCWWSWATRALQHECCLCGVDKCVVVLRLRENAATSRLKCRMLLLCLHGFMQVLLRR